MKSGDNKKKLYRKQRIVGRVSISVYIPALKEMAFWKVPLLCFVFEFAEGFLLVQSRDRNL